MTPPPGHEDLIQRLGIALLESVPEGWRRIDLVSVTAQDPVLTVIMDDGTRAELEPPLQAGEIVGALRSMFDDPTLSSARFTVDPPAALNYSYEFDHEPEFAPPLDAVRADELVKGFSTSMIHSLPAEWDQLFVAFGSVGGFVEVQAQIITVLGETVDWTPPSSVAEFFLRLKDGMARPGEGAWTSVHYHLVHPGRYNADYDWDGEPDWADVPPREFFVAEAAQHPRDPVPEWLRHRIDGK